MKRSPTPPRPGLTRRPGAWLYLRLRKPGPESDGSLRERGETLVELLITTVILSIAVVAVVGGLAVSIRMSDVHRKQATAGAAVRAFAEALQARVAANGYTPCALAAVTFPVDPTSSPTDYPLTGPNVVYAAPAGYTPSYTGVAYWVTAPTNAFRNTCPANDSGVLRVSLRVQSNDHAVAETLDVVLRRPCRAGETCAL
jgi:type II secretory pathway pseudopilin PulG